MSIDEQWIIMNECECYESISMYDEWLNGMNDECCQINEEWENEWMN